jgi:hypothetical protein
MQHEPEFFESDGNTQRNRSPVAYPCLPNRCSGVKSNKLLDIDSTPGRGTRILAGVPLEQEP